MPFPQEQLPSFAPPFFFSVFFPCLVFLFFACFPALAYLFDKHGYHAVIVAAHCILLLCLTYCIDKILTRCIVKLGWFVCLQKWNNFEIVPFFKPSLELTRFSYLRHNCLCKGMQTALVNSLTCSKPVNKWTNKFPTNCSLRKPVNFTYLKVILEQHY